MTAKVLKTERSTITLGLDDGSFRVVYRSEIDFNPEKGSFVDVYESNGQHIYAPHEEAAERNRFNQHVESAFTGEKVRVNRLLYIVVAFFFGWIGVHKFITRKYIQGLLYLVFCWTCVPAILSLIDLFRAAFKKPDENGNILI